MDFQFIRDEQVGVTEFEIGAFELGFATDDDGEVVAVFVFGFDEQVVGNASDVRQLGAACDLVLFGLIADGDEMGFFECFAGFAVLSADDPDLVGVDTHGLCVVELAGQADAEQT